MGLFWGLSDRMHVSIGFVSLISFSLVLRISDMLVYSVDASIHIFILGRSEWELM